MKKLLIANRGEIALRIAKTAKRMGIGTIAVYHTEDKYLPFVDFADEAVCLGDGSLTETYLNAAKLVDIALQFGADAIHPGYGFLSENAQFAKLCGDAGITFVGPSADVIALMGDKTASRKYAQSLGIPVVQGYEGSPHEILSKVTENDYPLLVKPAHGGGGKGMKIANNATELEQVLGSASREALRYFGSDTVFVEHLVLFPRHIEVQIMADSHGNIIHLYDRECTLQRRFQKVVEEAPSPSLSPEQRAYAYELATLLSASCGYQNAGTVELLLDTNGMLYFLEMNTRLQVEHPVTEAVTGVDIVELQLTIARGLALPFTQEDVKVNGHAIELRLIAEDAQNGFMPSVGEIKRLSIPTSVRFDGGYSEGCRVTPHFDSLIGKIVIKADDRLQAIAQAVDTVENSSLLGIQSNLPFLRQLLLSSSFQENRIHTDFIDRSLGDIVEEIQLFKKQLPMHIIIAAYVMAQHERASLHSWQLFYAGSLMVDGIAVRYFATRQSNELWVTVDGIRQHVLVSNSQDVLRLTLDGIAYGLHLCWNGALLQLCYKSVDWVVAPLRIDKTGARPSKQLSDFERNVTSPLNGRVVEVKVEKGQKVARGALLLVVESMKMENSIFAPADATIGEVFVEVAQQVEGGTTLLHLI